MLYFDANGKVIGEGGGNIIPPNYAFSAERPANFKDTPIYELACDQNGNVIKDADFMRYKIGNAITEAREKRSRGGVQVNGAWFHTDPESRVQHLGLKDQARDMLAAGGKMTDAIVIAGNPVQWKTMSGTFVPMTVQLAFDIVAAVGVLDAISFANAETHLTALQTAADPEVYDYSTGWPAVYVSA